MSRVEVRLDRFASPDRARSLFTVQRRDFLRQVFGVTSLQETLLDVVVLALTLGIPCLLRHHFPPPRPRGARADTAELLTQTKRTTQVPTRLGPETNSHREYASQGTSTLFGLHPLGRTLSMNPVEKTIRRIDGLQQRHTVPSFVFGVMKKFGDDSAGTLAALIAYYGFLSIFPLLLVLTTLLGLFFAHDTALQTRIINSAVGQFPIVGKQLSGPHGVRSLRSGSVVGLAVGLIGLVWGSLGVSQAAQRAMAEVWNVPGVIRPGFLPRLGRSVEFLALLALDLGLTTFLAGTVTLGHRPLWFAMLAVLITLAANVAVYVLGFRILTPKSIKTNCLIAGAILAGVGWTILQYAGTLLVGHTLRHANQIYGYFGSVLGLISFLYLAAELTVYAAEVNVVLKRKLYPRSIAPPPLTDADRVVLSAVAEQLERRPEQRVHVEFSPTQSDE